LFHLWYNFVPPETKLSPEAAKFIARTANAAGQHPHDAVLQVIGDESIARPRRSLHVAGCAFPDEWAPEELEKLFFGKTNVPLATHLAEFWPIAEQVEKKWRRMKGNTPENPIAVDTGDSALAAAEAKSRETKEQCHALRTIDFTEASGQESSGGAGLKEATKNGATNTTTATVTPQKADKDGGARELHKSKADAITRDTKKSGSGSGKTGQPLGVGVGVQDDTGSGDTEMQLHAAGKAGDPPTKGAQKKEVLPSYGAGVSICDPIKDVICGWSTCFRCKAHQDPHEAKPCCTDDICGWLSCGRCKGKQG